MKSAKTFSLISLSSILLMACQNTASSQTVPAPVSPPYVTYPTAGAPSAAPAWTAPDSAPVAAIEQAADPSAAIQAYAYARQLAPNDISIEQVYVRRMVAFGLPEMAESQANDVLQRQPTDGIAWAVAAYMHAKRDQTPEGLSSIALAAKYAPNDPFVLRTAGQLVAWYDTRAGKGATADTQNKVRALKAQLAANPDYADAYSHAVAEYGKMGADGDVAPQTGPQAAAATPPNASAQQMTPGVASTSVPADVAPVYATPAYVAPDYVSYPDPYYVVDPYADWYPTPCWTADSWWPSFGAFVVIDDDFRSHHRDFDHHDFDGRHDHDRSGAAHDTDPHWVGDRTRGTTVAAGNRATSPLRSGTVATPAGQTARMTAPGVRSSAQLPRSVSMPQARSAVSAQEPRWEFPRSSASASQGAPRFAAPQTSVPRFSTPGLSGSRSFSTPSGFGGGRDFGGGSDSGAHFTGGSGMHMGGGGGGGHGGGGRR